MDALVTIGCLIVGWVVFVSVASIHLLLKVSKLRDTVRVVERRLQDIEKMGVSTMPEPEKQPETVEEAEPVIESEQEPIVEESIIAEEPVIIAHSAKIEEPEPEAPEPAAPEPAAEQIPEDLPPRTIDAALAFLKGGNIWVAVGVLFVVLGLTFAYLYVADQIPNELKIAMGFVFGMLLFALGWKQRIKRRIFGMVIQGGGIGAMYLTLFASVKIYDVLPIAAVFAMMTVLIALSAALSMLQNSQVMAIFSAVIGYAAPLLLSSGSGNYVILFSYYILINLSIMVAAFKKYWRYLNSIGFIFTFAVFVLWAMDSYTLEYFRNAEIFLVAFFLIYTAINILATLRQPSFIIENAFAVTTSFTYITIQLWLAGDYEYGQSIASATLGVFYIVLSYGLVRYNFDRLRNLVTMYLGLGIVFVNMTIPLLLDGAWVAGIWAVEGAALVIMGVHQSNRFFRYFGGILIALGSFTAWNDYEYSRIFMLNSIFLTRMLAAAAFLTAAECYRRMNTPWEAEGSKGILQYINRGAFYVSLTAGLITWYTSFAVELDYLPAGDTYNIFLAFVSISAVLFSIVALKVKFNQMKYIILSPIAYVVLMFIAASVVNDYGVHFYAFPDMFLLTEWRWIGWLAFFLCSPVMMTIIVLVTAFCKNARPPRWMEVPILCMSFPTILYAASLKDLRSVSSLIMHRIGTIAMFFIITLFVACNIGYLIANLSSYTPYIYSATAIAFVVFIIWTTTRLYDHDSDYKLLGAGAMIVYLLLWVLFSSGNPLPEAALPFINFLELPAVLIFVATAYWLIGSFTKYVPSSIYRIAMSITGAIAFIWMHCMIGRAVVFAYNGYYDGGWLMSSGTYQLLIAILWGITGFTLMKTGVMLAKRRFWITGASLLALDSIKLLMVDLSKVGTLPRIGSFMVVGLLFIAIGYFVPLPPANKENVDEAD